MAGGLPGTGDSIRGMVFLVKIPFRGRGRGGGAGLHRPVGQAIRAMGLKVCGQGVDGQGRCAVVPGYTADSRTMRCWRQRQTRSGYPVLIKAWRGRRQRVMRLVDEREGSGRR